MYSNQMPEMSECIDDCLVHRECLDTAMQRCIELGGTHVEPRRLRLILSCSELCQAAARLMMIGTEHHRQICRVCAEVCKECEEDCARLGDMESCVEACRRCAESCRKMAA